MGKIEIVSFLKKKKVDGADSSSFKAITTYIGKDKSTFFFHDKKLSLYLKGLLGQEVKDGEINFIYIEESQASLLLISGKYYFLSDDKVYITRLDIIDERTFVPNVIKKNDQNRDLYTLGKDKNFEYSFVDDSFNSSYALLVKKLNNNISYKQDVSDYFVDFDGNLYANGKLVNDSYIRGSLKKYKNDLIESEYYRDNRFVYYKSKKLDEADLQSFKVVVHKLQYPSYKEIYNKTDFAVDKNNKYHSGSKITSEWPAWEREYERAMENFVTYLD